LALSRSLFELFLKQGGEFLAAEVTGFKFQGQRVSALHTDHPIPCREVFITAGA
jgi:hypothetical protein